MNFADTEVLDEEFVMPRKSSEKTDLMKKNL